MNEWYMVEYQIAQSGESRVPHFAWGLLKKRLDQSNRQELHAAISCHAFCSTQHGSIHCSAPTHANSTSWIQVSAVLPVVNVPSCQLPTHTEALPHAHMHKDTHSHTQLLWSFPGSMTWLPMSHKTHPFLDPTAESHCYILTFSPTQLIKHSLCCVEKAIPVNGVITDSKLGVFSLAER